MGLQKSDAEIFEKNDNSLTHFEALESQKITKYANCRPFC